MRFKLGDSVFVMVRSQVYYAFQPWREGTITAVGEDAVRVRTVTRLPWGKVRWFNLGDPCVHVCPITE